MKGAQITFYYNKPHHMELRAVGIRFNGTCYTFKRPANATAMTFIVSQVIPFLRRMFILYVELPSLTQAKFLQHIANTVNFPLSSNCIPHYRKMTEVVKMHQENAIKCNCIYGSRCKTLALYKNPVM